MRNLCQIAIAVTAVALLFTQARADDAKKEQEKLQGTWSIVAGEKDGTPDEEIKKDKLVVAAEKMTIKKGAGGDEEAVTFTLDPTQKPKQLDIDSKGGKILAIYELEGDNLKLCFSRPGSERPTDFSTKAGSNRMLVTLKRDK
jgi:uncharacterized protein (TIGR03067 family)